MKKVTVKICGLMKSSDVKLCMKQGVDIVGFVTEYPVPVPWNLNRTTTASLLRKVCLPHQSCIVTGGSPDKVISLAAQLKPSMVQLHHQESLEDTDIIANNLGKIGIAVIKTIPPSGEDRLAQFGTVDIKAIVEALHKTNVHALLADSRSPANAAAKGTVFDYNFVRQIVKLSSKPVIIAGGITYENVCDILTATGAKFIDVMTGVENKPGDKNARLLSKLLSNAHNCQDLGLLTTFENSPS